MIDPIDQSRAGLAMQILSKLPGRRAAPAEAVENLADQGGGPRLRLPVEGLDDVFGLRQHIVR